MLRDTRHAKIVPGKRAKVFVREKVVPPARVILPAETTRPPPPPPSCLASPRRVGDPHVNGLLNLSKIQVRSQLAQGNSGVGLSRVPETI